MLKRYMQVKINFNATDNRSCRMRLLAFLEIRYLMFKIQLLKIQFVEYLRIVLHLFETTIVVKISTFYFLAIKKKNL